MPHEDDPHGLKTCNDSKTKNLIYVTLDGMLIDMSVTVNTLGTRSTNLSFYGSVVVDRRDKFFLLRHVRFESTIHWSSATYLWVSWCVSSPGCLLIDIRYVTSLLSHLRLKEWHLFLKLCAWVSKNWCIMAHEAKHLRKRDSLRKEEIISALTSDNLS
jgi:hypothetical protein